MSQKLEQKLKKSLLKTRIFNERKIKAQMKVLKILKNSSQSL